MIMCVLLCYPVSIRIYYQQGGLFLVFNLILSREKNQVTLRVLSNSVKNKLGGEIISMIK